MKRLDSILIATVALVMFTQTGWADGGRDRPNHQQVRDDHGNAAPVPRPAFPSWSQQITHKRFLVLTSFGSLAVLDNETGLVWEQSPSTGTFGWSDAQSHCNSLNVGGRLGWRLPTLQELASLVDPSAAVAPFLPAGHPFSNVQSSSYWSATTEATNFPCCAWIVRFFLGDVITFDKAINDTTLAWCVRGGQGVDPQ